MAKHALSLGPYGLLTPIGKGAAGQVWRARHTESGLPLAIKILRGPQPDRALRAMQQELRAVARMDHPGIVRVHDHGRLPAALARALEQAPDSPYIVMDFAGRQTLRRALAKRPWPAVRSILLALLDALAHAHARGVIHRDLKPANVLLGESGPVLTDFGIALAFDRGDAAPSSSGTPNYMAPEQVSEEHRAIGPWTDLYALGCLSYALATGRAPFAGRGSIGALRGHLRETPARLDSVWPPAFATWVARLLAKSPHHRYRLAADAARDLAAISPKVTGVFFVSEEPPASAPTPLPDWQRPAPPHPAALAGVHRSLAGLRQIDPVGRVGEQAALWRALEATVAQQRTRVVLIEGITGSGRTHLARWLTRRAHELGVAERLVAEHQPPVGAVDGLGSMMADHLRLRGLTGSAAISRTADALDLERDDSSAAAIAAVAAADRQVVDGDRIVQLLGPGEYEATLSLALGHLTSRRPHILLIDDAQWAPEAVGFVEHLLDRWPDLPLLVVLTVARDLLDPAHATRLGQLTGRPAVELLRLAPLSDAAIAEMVRRLAPAGPALVEALVERAVGDPSRAAGLLRLWGEQAALAQDGDGLRLIGNERPMPSDDALWLGRIDQVLGDAEPSIWACLELAATFGHRIWPDLWTGLAQHAAVPVGPTLDGVLADLSDAGLVLDDAYGWSLAHGRIRDALVRRARDGGRLAEWHRICAAVLGQLPDARPEHLAAHRMAAGDPSGAVGPYIAAAIAARRRTEIPRIRRALLGAARALRAGRAGRDDPRWVELHARWALADVSRGRLERSRHRAMRADRRASDPRDRALAAYALGEATLGLDPRAAELHLRRAEGHARSAGLDRLAMRCAEARGWSLYHRGRVAAVDRLVEATLGTFTRPPALLEANLRFLQAVAARAQDDPSAALHLARAANLYRAAGARHGQASVQNEMGEVALRAGRLEDALGHYRASRHIFDALAHRSVIVADLNLGRVHDALGEHRTGERHRREALRLAERHGDPAMMAFAAVCLLVDTARRGRFDRWSSHFAHLETLESGTLVALEAAEAARDAATFAEAAGARSEARRALRLAAVQFERLNRTADADAMDRRAAALIGQSDGGDRLSGDAAGSGRPSGV